MMATAEHDPKIDAVFHKTLLEYIAHFDGDDVVTLKASSLRAALRHAERSAHGAPKP